MTTYVKCPTCSTRVRWEQQQPNRPFCSERCKLIDLGAWATEEHRIAGAAVSEIVAEDDAPL